MMTEFSFTLHRPLLRRQRRCRSMLDSYLVLLQRES